MTEHFKCANQKCNNTIAIDGLNTVKLKVLRRWYRTCDRCGQKTKWLEQSSLLNTNTEPSTTNGGYQNATVIKNNQINPN